MEVSFAVSPAAPNINVIWNYSAFLHFPMLCLQKHPFWRRDLGFVLTNKIEYDLHGGSSSALHGCLWTCLYSWPDTVKTYFLRRQRGLVERAWPRSQELPRRNFGSPVICFGAQSQFNPCACQRPSR